MFFAEVVLPLDVCVPQVSSFLALCDALDMLAHVQEGIVTDVQLDQSITKPAQLCKVAYGDLFWVYKHHGASIHLVDQYRRHGLLISLFTHERRHKICKRYIKDRKKLRGFERGVIEEITLQHLYDLQSDLVKEGLHAPREPKRSQRDALLDSFPDARSIKVASSCSLANGAVAHHGDAVAFRCDDHLAVGELLAIFRIERIDGTSDDAVCINKWRPLGTTSRYYKNFAMCDQTTFGLLTCLLAPLHVSMDAASNVASCIIPAPLQAAFSC